MPQHSLGFPARRLSPRVVIIHPDECLLDLLQFELERCGVPNRALVPDSELGYQGLVPFLPAQLALCVVGLRPPYPAGQALLAELAATYPTCTPVLMAADPAAALGGWQGRVCSLVHETADVEQTVAAILTAVHTALPRLLAAEGA